jgi:hypothetical protein
MSLWRESSRLQVRTHTNNITLPTSLILLTCIRYNSEKKIQFMYDASRSASLAKDFNRVDHHARIK